MPDHLVESRGYFWPSELTVPDTAFAHTASVAGTLRVSEAGRIDLELDAPLAWPELTDSLTRLFRQGPVEGSVAGVLAGTDERVWLGGLVTNGASAHANGPSTEAYLAHQCLISREPIPAGGAFRFSTLELPLDGLEDWLHLKGIKVAKTARTVRATYRKPKTHRWSLEGQTLELIRWIDGLHAEEMGELAWRERASLRLVRPSQSLTAENALDLASSIEDLMILLTDSNRGLPFPILRWTGRSAPVRFYYPRFSRVPDPVKWHRCWATLAACRETFGALLQTWLAHYGRFGPGVHLYLGNRRGQVMYPEHRFASLMWGLEALHRTLFPTPEANPKLAVKVKRILDAIEKQKDRDWAERMLPTSDEPSLATRIAQLVGTLPLEFEPAQLQRFAQLCARRRNDVSHFGGRRQPGDYEAFLDDVQRLNSALDLLYHALLLHLAGLPTPLVRRRFIGGPNSYSAARVLEEVGITPPGEKTTLPLEEDAAPADNRSPGI